MITYDVYTDLDPEQLTEVAKETYRQWLSFALGRDSPVGRKLRNPTGRYAASLSWQRTGEARVSIIADETIAPEGKWIETGTEGADMLQMLLSGGKVAKDGHRYRVIPMRSDRWDKLPAFNFNRIVRNKEGGEKLPAGLFRMWSKPRPHIEKSRSVAGVKNDSPGTRFRTMSEDSPGWMVPPMTMYSPGLILSALLRTQYGQRQ
jgi:hypothetical protein